MASKGYGTFIVYPQSRFTAQGRRKSVRTTYWQIIEDDDSEDGRLVADVFSNEAEATVIALALNNAPRGTQ